ncbi:hypothetical protein FRC03_006450 [Tulasnella sp. 419]|nr:hypothetical protein FRC02_005386 [Tulasnella sp. 418]KAG8960524.1 hypothetical protein FRC03_006450 [Tulasnella sp. 419]
MSSSNSYAYARRRNGVSSAVGGQSVGGSTTGIDAKVVIMGDPGVGKTSLVHRYTTNTFSAARTAATPGAQFHTKKTVVDGTNVRLQIWDTAGQERFRSMAPMYYRGANAAVVVYDITMPSTLDNVKVWLEELKKNTSPDSDMIIYIVGAKSDLKDRRAVTLEDARRKLLTWFPPPERPKPPSPPPTASALIPYLGPGYPFTSASSIYPSPSTAFSLPNQLTQSISNTLSIPAQLSNLSNQLPTLPTLPSFNIRRPRFTSLTSSRSAIPISPEPPTATAAETSSNSNIASTPSSSATSNSTHLAASSASQLPQSPVSAIAPLPPTTSTPSTRVAFPRSQTATAFAPSMSHLGGLNVNMAGSQYSGFSRHGGQRHGHGHSNSVTAFTGLGDEGTGGVPGSRSNMVRRNTTSAGPQSAASRSAALLMMTNGGASGNGSASGDERFVGSKQWKSGIGRRDDVLEDSSGVEDDIDTGDVSDEEDELPAGMELFEVSAKDNDGVPNLFSAVIQAIIKRRHKIEEERSLRERDSIMLGSPARQWGDVAEEDDDDDDPSGKKKSGWGLGWGTCCTS